MTETLPTLIEDDASEFSLDTLTTHSKHGAPTVAGNALKSCCFNEVDIIIEAGYSKPINALTMMEKGALVKTLKLHYKKSCSQLTLTMLIAIRLCYKQHPIILQLQKQPTNCVPALVLKYTPKTLHSITVI